ncbi:2Fe-2S iron-sulfur cluster-binding protein [Catenovulum sp. 2E275]|uniref:2Fe-2S iron-sulfur cluster-binding protein n=1 Tax=Catenovulum sp. 2E275 TaxID=2980497 RepID=UPI0021CE934E|nr:2Fe-2S iron-sulfur cluster-binding protein [Catenovulum sp. 2E275]MCU4675824.1 2Fe-2S iron-sulfur cluster-binding protein [Catenovulum sp. 2E275]
MKSCTVTLKPSNVQFTVEPLETIVEAALRQNIDFPYSCMQGTCDSCVCNLLAGKVSYGDLPYIFTQEEKEQGITFACIAYPLTDIVLYQPNVHLTKRI